MTVIYVKVKTKEYFIKKAKPISNASQIYLNKKYIGLYMNLIPVKLFNEKNIEKYDDYYLIKINTNCIFRKKAKKRGRGAYCYLPSEYSGEDILIFEAPS